MPHLLVLAQRTTAFTDFQDSLIEKGLACSMVSNEEEAFETISFDPPDLLIIDMDGTGQGSDPAAFVNKIKDTSSVPVIALVAHSKIRGKIAENGYFMKVDDFLISPYEINEIVLRINRLIHTRPAASGELIKSGGLLIDLARCEVTVFGRVIELTFKEYELIRFLAGNKGRVFSREALLNKVWGYDYYGGDRTVDTHIRRIRSKIEDANNTYIETVRNVGYRFRRD